MGSNQDIEMIKQAIEELIQDKRIKDASSELKPSQNYDDNYDDEEQLLSRLLSQLESLRESEISDPVQEEEEIVKELKALKRQNTITHCLVSALIVVTVIWEVSEVSMFLKLIDGFNHPFRSFGNMLVEMVLPRSGGGGVINVLDGGGDAEHHCDLINHVVDPLLPSVVIPELPNVEFPHIGSNGEGRFR